MGKRTPHQKDWEINFFFQNKQDTEQPVAVRAPSFRKHMKIYGGSSESDIPVLFRQTEIREVTRKLELRKGFQF